MMVEPFELIANYVRHSDAHIRRNVAVAISTLPTLESVATLLDMASHDPDPEVRETAECQLAGLDPAYAPLVREELARRVHVEDPAKRTVANALAGRLYLRGFDLRAPEDRLLQRLRALSSGNYVRTLSQLARDLARRFQQAGVSRRLSFRTVWAGFVGATLPVMLVCLYLTISSPLSPSADAYFQILTITAFSAIALTLRVGRRDEPLILQWDEPAAIARDIVETTIWATAIVASFTFLMALGVNVKPGAAVKIAVIAAAVMSVALAAVHLGNAAFADQARIGTYARFQRYFVAWSAGIAVLTLALIIGRQLNLTDTQAIVVEGIWLFGVPSCGALALILARQDTTSFGISITNRRRRRTRRVASIALALTGGGILSFGMWQALEAYFDARHTNAPLSSINWDSVSGAPKDVTLLWRPPRTTYQFRLPFPQRLEIPSASMAEQRPLNYSLYATDRANPNIDACTWNEDDRGYVSYSAYSESVRVLPAGCYVLQVLSRRGYVSGRLWTVLLARTKKGPEIIGSTEQFAITLNADGAVAPNGQPIDSSRHAGWVARQDDPPQVIRLSERLGVSVRTGRPPSALILDSRDVDISVTQGATSTVVRNELDLQPGQYSIAVKPLPGTPPVSAYLSFVPPRPREVWPVTTLPTQFPFKLQTYSKVVAELIRRARPDRGPERYEQELMLELMRLDGRVLNEMHGPGTIRTELSTGEYRLVVRTTRSANESSPVQDLPVRPWLVRLEIQQH